MFSIFKKKKVRRHLLLHINMPLQPMHRHSLEDHIENVMGQRKLGEVTGGGTALNEEKGCVESCDIEIDLFNPSDDRLRDLADMINQIGVAKGSALICQDTGEEISVGTLEGMALYLNGTELPDEVYPSSDINELIDRLLAAMDGLGALYSSWEGREWTVLYFYGESFEKMKESILPVVATYPLCAKSRIEQNA
ncbi:MAG: hypothetical protein Q4C37_10810 [Bacteroidales bacterium]|nr:hypothetical protein [Bacteroidales bacterium]